MSKSVQIHIPQPCHENWQHMTPKEQGRFCGSKKNKSLFLFIRVHQEVNEVVIISISWFYTGREAGIFI
jgi:hypothetical protein